MHVYSEIHLTMFNCTSAVCTGLNCVPMVNVIYFHRIVISEEALTHSYTHYSSTCQSPDLVTCFLICLVDDIFIRIGNFSNSAVLSPHLLL